ncbi:MAG: hypothetical protein JWN03_4310 [Nocardia sp.]|uniref:hypothetical protein n=1 Tax=Nocardia sp. TaxID=1821 RepID=UPI002604C68C|nr:hypothetical protein [Nocardia sp.]MCU1644035.1 hypothetical protein [Nocardia sp.]
MTAPSTRDRDLPDDLIRLLAHRVPQQFVTSALTDDIATISARLGLPRPTMLAGNLIVGDLRTAAVLLSAHLDEASFSVTGVHQDRITLAACHRLPPQLTQSPITILGYREGAITVFGDADLACDEHGLHIAPMRGVLLGDRAVYSRRTTRVGHRFSSAAIDDRAGAVIALSAAARLHHAGVPTAVVLSDGEQNTPDGYFSRTFPHVLHQLHPRARIIFVDGIFHDDLRRGGFQVPPPGALIVPHSGDGTGYSVPPAVFAWLRDDAVPRARAEGIDVQITSARHSRGDDWGMVTNPTSGADRTAIFVSFGGFGDTPADRIIDLRCLQQCVDFITYCAPLLP